MGVVVLVLESSGVLSRSYIGQATLALVALLATSEIVERQHRLSKLESLVQKEKSNLQAHNEAVLESLDDSSNRIIHALKGARVKSFSTVTDFAAYFSRRVRDAERVLDTYLQTRGPRSRDPEWKNASDKIQRAADHVCRDPDVDWREIVVFSTEEIFEQMRKRIEEARNYSIAYFDKPTEVQAPHIAFAIVDEEVFLMGAGSLLTTEQPDIVTFFRDYHETMWKQAEEKDRLLRVGSRVYQDRLKGLDHSWT
jgi:hypothetical protein